MTSKRFWLWLAVFVILAIFCEGTAGLLIMNSANIHLRFSTWVAYKAVTGISEFGIGGAVGFAFAVWLFKNKKLAEAETNIE
ncbi:hypothetical protein KAZ57_01085 [Patescibacteria group bacterium]|nr:hypothetical protein [Patescibacteria group bacterium]